LKEQEIRRFGGEWDREGNLFKAWAELLQTGLHFKERAEQRSTSDGWKKLWHEKVDGKSPGVQFGLIQEQVIFQLREERDRILAAPQF
jgi:hypothetical protein